MSADKDMEVDSLACSKTYWDLRLGRRENELRRVNKGT
jgi:hypothetical protein